MIIAKAHEKSELLAVLSKKLRDLKTKFRIYFKAMLNSTSKGEGKYENLIQDHLSNTLGIINLMSEQGISKGQIEHLASLKSSCDKLVVELQLPIKSMEAPTQRPPKKYPRKQISTEAKGNILYVCDQPVQKKIIKNLLQQWGYKTHAINNLPDNASLLNALNVDLIILSKSGNNQSPQIIETLKTSGLEFLVLANFLGSFSRKAVDYPMIEGPVDPDFLKYKVNKLLTKKKQLNLSH